MAGNSNLLALVRASCTPGYFFRYLYCCCLKCIWYIEFSFILCSFFTRFVFDWFIVCNMTVTYFIFITAVSFVLFCCVFSDNQIFFIPFYRRSTRMINFCSFRVIVIENRNYNIVAFCARANVFNNFVFRKKFFYLIYF